MASSVEAVIKPHAMNPQSVLIVAGEASADAHGAKVLEALRQQHPELYAFGIGGQAMRAQQFDALVPAEAMSLAGLTEVLWALPRMLRTMRQIVQAARKHRPRVALLIDLPDFNLRLARRLKALNIPVVYYISPQLWAWREKRVRQIQHYVDRMLVILPFEKPFYERHGVQVDFVGHPLVEQLADAPSQHQARQQLVLPPAPAQIVALLPGSRNKEVSRHLPVMLAGVRLLRQKYPDLQVVLPIASTIDPKLIASFIQTADTNVRLVPNQATQALAAANAAVVCSGTATLQAALLLRPMVVVYQVSWLSYQILRRLIQVAHIALVNLIANERLVPELIQETLTPENIAKELEKQLQQTSESAVLIRKLSHLRSQFGQEQTGANVAQALENYLQNDNKHPSPPFAKPR